MTVRGIEAINLYMPLSKDKIDVNIKEETGCTSKEESMPESASNIMNSVERYKQEWTLLLQNLDENPERVRRLAFNGDLKVSKFRSIFWALLLRVLNADYRNWKQQRAKQRDRYEKLKEEFVKNPHENVSNDNPDDNPLSQSTQSIWNQYFSDQELYAVIKQDVVRTFPGVDFFRKTIIQNSMCNILFYFAREHPYMCYRQGMHEILAPLLFVLYGDHQSLLHFKEIASMNFNEILFDVLNPDFLEADTYFVFSRVMSSIESYYRVTNFVQNTHGEYMPVSPDNSVISTELEVIGQLNIIRDKILAKQDLHLHTYLMKLDIPLHIFGIRWLRLLFGREFPLLDLLIIWDAIFADSDRFDLPNYILVAMLVHIRDKLLLSDYTTCLTYLMRYPSNVDINLILRHALHMQTPKNFDRPENAFVYFTMTSNLNIETPSPKLTMERNSKIPLGAKNPPNPVSSSKATQLQRIRRSTSLSETDRVEKQIIFHQSRNAANSAALARLNTSAEIERIMEGYSTNSPELVRLELQNAQTIIKIAHSKLRTYLTTVRKNVPKNSPKELVEAIDGIDELCNLLDIKLMFPLQVRTAPIDQALEANEQQKQESQGITLKKSLGEEKGNVNVVIKNQLSHNRTRGNVAYERPDNGFMLNSTRVLGNLKEIELIPIVSDEQIVDPIGVSQRQNGMPIIDPLERTSQPR